MKRFLRYAVAVVAMALLGACSPQTYDVVVVGGGVSGTTAASTKPSVRISPCSEISRNALKIGNRINHR